MNIIHSVFYFKLHAEYSKMVGQNKNISLKLN